MSPTPTTNPTPGLPPRLRWSEKALRRLVQANALVTDHVYLMIYPSADAARQMRRHALASCHKFNLRRPPCAAERLHATLFFPCVCGELSCEKLDAVADVVLEPLDAALSPRV